MVEVELARTYHQGINAIRRRLGIESFSKIFLFYSYSYPIFDEPDVSSMEYSQICLRKDIQIQCVERGVFQKKSLSFRIILYKRKKYMRTLVYAFKRIFFS